jgi:alkaline phosphatase D
MSSCFRFLKPFLSTFWFLGLFIALQAAGAQPIRITHGVASGDVASRSAVIWSRADRTAEMHVEYDTNPAFPHPNDARSTNSAQNDFTATVQLEGLEPATRYYYRVIFVDSNGNRSQPHEGEFHTAPQANVAAPVSFLVGGDLAGQRYCRAEGEGFEIFRHMEELSPDFFIANGDMIYADNDCPPEGPAGWKNIPGDFPSVSAPEIEWTNRAQIQDIIWKHWRYNRADPHFQSFLSKVPIYVQWDDHEVINDFGASWPSWTADVNREGFPNLVAAGLEALFQYNPMARHPTEPRRIYRSFRWGADLELFLIDARSYRSFNDLADGSSHSKTLLGAEQLEWLKQGLIRSNATWKVVSSDVPLSVPTGSDAHLYGRDAWANGQELDYSSRTGFERELMEFLTFLDENNLRNLVFVVTDVHFTMNLRYQIDIDGDGDHLLFHELLNGPLNAGMTPTPPQLDPTLQPIILYGEGNLFNFASIRIERRDGDDTAYLVSEIRDPNGQPRFGSRLELKPE